MLGVCYYPEHWAESRWAEDARRMREVGITYVRIGEFAWSRLEPNPGDLRWDWLDRAIETLGAAGLKIVLGTPTPTPPKWLIDRNPEVVAVDKDGRPRGFGSRRHYDFSSEPYRRETVRFVELMAARYGQNPHVAGWQTDNEFGCHSTVLSYSAAAKARFRRWLQQRYAGNGGPLWGVEAGPAEGSAGIEKLNAAWGNVFWSMEYRSWAEIDLPNLTVTEANPAHWLDFWRFASDEVVSYNRLHVEIIRKHSPGRFITHNFMGLFTEFDHFDVCEDLDLSSWDSYPAGFTEQFRLTEAEKIAYAATGHPDMAAFHHDLYRAVGRGRWWVMEQQPGPVNWAPWNPAPKPGMIRMWTWEALAHGAEVVSYFRWRQAPFAQEQMHAGLNRPDGKLDLGGEEATRVGRELQSIPLEDSVKAPVALVFDYQAAWMLNIQPQGADYSYLEMAYRWYEGVRSLGLDVDFVRPGADLRGYKLVVVPSLPLVTDRAAEAFAAADGLVLFAPRCGSKVEGFQIPPELPPGPLKGLLPLTVWRVESLRPGTGQAVSGAAEGMVERWREHVETDLKPLSLFADGSGALYRHGRAFYMAGWPDRALLDGTLRMLADEAGLPALRLPEGIRLRRRGGLAFAFNFGASAQSLPVPHGTRFVLGGPQLAPQDVAAWRV